MHLRRSNTNDPRVLLHPSEEDAPLMGSISSTFEVDFDMKACGSEEICDSASSRRRVEFNEALNVSYENPHMCQEDCEELWYKSEDYMTFKINNTESAKDILRKHAEHILSDNNKTNSFQTVMEGTFEAFGLAEDEESEQELLDFCLRLYAENVDQWKANGEAASLVGRLGLERSTCRNLRQDRKERRMEIIDKVLWVQDEHNFYMPSEEDQETKVAKIAQTSQEISRPSRLFAAYLAQVQTSYDVRC